MSWYNIATGLLNTTQKIFQRFIQQISADLNFSGFFMQGSNLCRFSLPLTNYGLPLSHLQLLLIIFLQNDKLQILIFQVTALSLEKSRDSKIQRLFEFREEKWFSLYLVSGLGKLAIFWGRMRLRMKLIAQKELIFLFQMAPSRILWDQ